MKRLAIVIRDDAYDRLYTPLTFAYVAAKRGVEVDILFVLWAVRVLTEQGARAVRIDPQHAAEEAWFMDRLRRDGDPLEILDFIKMVKDTGHARLYGCRLAAATFDVRNGHARQFAFELFQEGGIAVLRVEHVYLAGFVALQDFGSRILVYVGDRG